jgi:WhiB family redox-sensing transcriptional regulator
VSHDEIWRLHAACASGLRLWLLGLVVDVPFDAEMWFPERGDADQAAAAAKSVCAACPVREDCLLDALDRWEVYGIWAGAGEPVRRALKAVPRCDHAGYDPACSGAFCLKVTEHFAHLEGSVSGAIVSYGAGARHGKASTYGRGCRCVPCRTAKREHERAAAARRRAETEAAS